MPRERRSKYANDAKDTVGIASQVESLSSSLAQIPNQIPVPLKAKLNQDRKTMFTFIDDDGTAEFLTRVKPVLDANGLKCTLAINPGLVGTTQGSQVYMTWEQLQTLQSEGFEIVNHGWVHQDPATLTDAQLLANYELEKAAFIAHGFANYDYFVYPGSMDWRNQELKDRLRKIYKCSYAITDYANQPNLPFDAYAIMRLQSHFIQATKDYTDMVVDNKGYLVLFTHAYDQTVNLTNMDNNLKYILNMGSDVTYAKVKDMIDNYKTVIDLGHGTGDYFYLDKNGNVDFSIAGVSAAEAFKLRTIFKNTKFTNAPLTSYKKNAITYEIILYSDAIALGLPETGTIKTTYMHYNSVIALPYGIREYTRGNAGNDIWHSIYNSTLGRWTPFIPTSGAKTRPRKTNIGTTVFDTTLNKPIFCKQAGWIANKTLARNTAYALGDVVRISNGQHFECTTAGTTGDTEPTWTQTQNIADGTVVWGYGGYDAVWVDATGTVVS
jgi:peptidoglycan/xylan/chitin deacetylase (PgdA/CDA1 family)